MTHEYLKIYNNKDLKDFDYIIYFNLTFKSIEKMRLILKDEYKLRYSFIKSNFSCPESLVCGHLLLNYEDHLSVKLFFNQIIDLNV